MPPKIDPSKVKWDSAPIDVGKVQWYGQGETGAGETGPEWSGRHPNLYGALGAGKALVRTGIEAGGTALGAAAGSLVPVPGASLVGAGAGYATGRRAADVMLGDESDLSAGGIAKDVAIGGLLQGAGNVVSKGVMRAMPQAWVDKLYGSSLKLSTSPNVLPIAERNALIQKGLSERAVPNMETGTVGKLFGFKGYNEVLGKIDKLNSEVEQIIAGASQNGQTVSSAAVATRLDDLIAKGGRISKVDPKYKDAVMKAKQELLDGPDEIPVEQAQEMKRHIYKVYKDYYGIDDQTAAYVQGKKAVARGLKEEIEGLYPEVKNLNLEEGQLLRFLDPFGRAAARIQNRDLIGLGMQIAPMTAAALTGGSGAAAKAGLITKLIDTPSLKSRLAILLDASKKAGTSRARQMLGASVPAIGEYMRNSGIEPVQSSGATRSW